MIAILEYYQQDVSEIKHSSHIFGLLTYIFLCWLTGITPLGDLNIEEGQPAELFCYLNTSHPDGVGGSYKNLSFWVDNQLMEEPIVQKYNDSAIRIRIDKTVVSPKGFYVVTCRQNMSKGICTRYVYVGCEFLLRLIKDRQQS